MSRLTYPNLVERLSPAVQAVPPSGIRKFFDLVAQSQGIISLGVGEPDFTTPWHIRDAGLHAIEKGRTTYTSNWGLLELRQAVAEYLRQWQGLQYDPESEVLITVGAAEGIDLALRTLVAPGDEVLIPEPCFVSYQALTRLAGGIPVPVPLRVENDFKLDPADLAGRITPRSKVLLMGFPNNPTGAVMSREELAAVARVVEEHDLLVISDEIYGELTYGGEHTAFASLPEMAGRTVHLSGFSKAFAMTGWRLGYACGPQPVLEAMMKIHQYAIMCPSTPSQWAALEALRHGRREMERMREEYDRRRRLMVDGLRAIGLPVFEPRGAFYIFPEVTGTGLDDEAFAMALLQEEQVAVVPGRAFGESGRGFVRASYASSVERLVTALERIERFVSRRR